MVGFLFPLFFASIGGYATYCACRSALKHKRTFSWHYSFWGFAAALIVILAFRAVPLIYPWFEPNTRIGWGWSAGESLVLVLFGLGGGGLVVGYYRMRSVAHNPEPIAPSSSPEKATMLMTRMAPEPGAIEPDTVTSNSGYEYFYALRGRQYGPVGFDRLRSLAFEGELRRTDKIWRRGMACWQPAGTLTAVFDKLPPDLPEAFTEVPPPRSEEINDSREGEARTRPQGTLYKVERAVFITAWPIGILFGTLGASLQEEPWRSQNFSFGPILCSILSFAFLGFAVFKWMQLHYRLWKMVPANVASTTPARAVVFYFIPLVNILWMFVTFGALAKDANRTLDKLEIRGRRCNEAMGLIFATVQACLCSLGVIFPALGVILLVVGYAVWIPFYADLCRTFDAVEQPS